MSMGEERLDEFSATFRGWYQECLAEVPFRGDPLFWLLIRLDRAGHWAERGLKRSRLWRLATGPFWAFVALDWVTHLLSWPFRVLVCEPFSDRYDRWLESKGYVERFWEMAG